MKIQQQVRYRFYALIALILASNALMKFRNVYGIDLIRDLLEILRQV